MAVSTGLIAVIPAPAGTPMEKIRQAIHFCRQSREIMKVLVAADRPIEAEVTAEGAWFFPATTAALGQAIPRPALLSDVAAYYEKRDGERVRLVLHLNPDKLMTDPLVVFECFQRVMINAYADGILGVTKGGAGGLAEKGEFLEADPEGPLAMDGSVYILEHSFLLGASEDWFSTGKFLAYLSAPSGAPSRGTFL